MKYLIVELNKGILTRKDYGTVELSREDLSQGDYISLKHSKSQQYIDENSSRRFIFNEGVSCKIQIVIDVHVYK